MELPLLWLMFSGILSVVRAVRGRVLERDVVERLLVVADEEDKDDDGDDDDDS